MASEKGNIRIVIADSQYLTRFALETLLQEMYPIAFVCSNYTDLLKWINTWKAELILLDHTLVDPDITSAISSLRQHIPHVVLLADEITQAEFSEFTSAGIEHMILKTIDREELFRAVEYCLKGRKYYSDEILQIIVERNSPKNMAEEFCRLTSSEMEVVKLIAEGLTTKEIAAKKFISFHTVMSHRKNIFRKAGVNSVSELIMYAIRAGWIDNIEYYI
jgi:DNA-binding NarL/FixJ family response regulator